MRARFNFVRLTKTDALFKEGHLFEKNNGMPEQLIFMNISRLKNSHISQLW